MKLHAVLFLQNTLLVFGQLQRPWTARDCQEMTRECDQVTRGVQGLKGAKGIPGRQGPPGPVGAIGPKGARGPPGRSRPGGPGSQGPPAGQRPRPGTPGDPGERGVKGQAGDRGDPGSPGQKGRKGYPGVGGYKGAKGIEGDSGRTGPPGNIGHPGTMGSWSRCSWEINRSKDNGLLKECIFTKQDSNSVLHVVYEGNLHIGLCKTCCKRWYFIFNDVECRSPGPIDAVLSGGLGLDYPFYSQGRIEGFCETRFSAGPVRVGLQMKNCPTYSISLIPYNLPLNNRYGSILIQEVSPSQ